MHPRVAELGADAMLPNPAEPIIFWYVTAIVITVATLAMRQAWRFVAQRAWRRPHVHEPAQLEPSAVFTLVHGTWARNAAWTRQDSPLRKQLRAICPSGTVRLFQWSGRNSERARRNASTDLRAFIKEVSDEYPRARHFVIAHSHGGNVALGAQSPKTAALLQGIICLATPVIVRRRKEIDRLTAFFLRWFAVPPAMIIAGYIEEYRQASTGYMIISALIFSTILMRWIQKKRVGRDCFRASIWDQQQEGSVHPSLRG